MQTERGLLVEKLVYSSDPAEQLRLRGGIEVYDQWTKPIDGISGKSTIETHYNQILNPKAAIDPHLDELGPACPEDSGQNY